MRHIENGTWRLLLEDRLEADEMLRLMGHLEECPDCQARYMEAITPRFEELAEPLMTEDLTARTMERIPVQEVPLPSSKVASIAPTVVKSRLSPARQFQQRLAAYAIAASLTMALMVGGAFAQLSSLPRLQVEPPASSAKPDDSPLAPKTGALGPLLPNTSVTSAAKAPFNIPPLRLLVERSIANDTKK